MEAEGSKEWRLLVKIQIACGNVFMGPGCKQLLHLIAEAGSVHLACQQMGLSYSKAWKIIRNLESELGYAVVARKQGGKNGGESCLTPSGDELLRWFDEFDKECTAAVHTIFERNYPTRPKG